MLQRITKHTQNPYGCLLFLKKLYQRNNQTLYQQNKTGKFSYNFHKMLNINNKDHVLSYCTAHLSEFPLIQTHPLLSKEYSMHIQEKEQSIVYLGSNSFHRDPVIDGRYVLMSLKQSCLPSVRNSNSISFIYCLPLLQLLQQKWTELLYSFLI